MVTIFGCFCVEAAIVDVLSAPHALSQALFHPRRPPMIACATELFLSQKRKER
jgi:hypothetical protein